MEDLNSILFFLCLESVNSSILKDYEVPVGYLRIRSQVPLDFKKTFEQPVEMRIKGRKRKLDEQDEGAESTVKVKNLKCTGKTDYTVLRIAEDKGYYLSVECKRGATDFARFQCGGYLKGAAERERDKKVSLFYFFRNLVLIQNLRGIRRSVYCLH